MQRWAHDELCGAELGDKRLTKRLINMVDHLCNSPSASVPEAFQQWSGIKAAYRFWDSDGVNPKAILQPHQNRTVERTAGHKRILAIQDTTVLDFSSHRKTTGLGYLYTATGCGLLLHNTLAATTGGVPLGLLDQQFWVRPIEELGTKPPARERSAEEKESYRWIKALKTTAGLMPAGVEVVAIADREADFYGLFAEPRPAHVHLLVRGMHNRRVLGEFERLVPAVEAAEPCGSLTAEIGRGAERAPRKAVLRLRRCSVEIVPSGRTDTEGSDPALRLGVVLAKEEAPPAGERGIEWLLLTALPLEDAEAVRDCVRYYSRRWLIERFHYVLKQGCRVESLQLERAERLERAAATYSLVAWRLLWLLYASREEPEASCELVLEADEWQALYSRVHQRPPPEKAPSLQLVVLWLARLGGFIGRKNDGQPGIQVLWRGLRRLYDITETWRIARSLSPPLVGNA